MSCYLAVLACFITRALTHFTKGGESETSTSHPGHPAASCRESHTREAAEGASDVLSRGATEQKECQERWHERGRAGQTEPAEVTLTDPSPTSSREGDRSSKAGGENLFPPT